MDFNLMYSNSHITMGTSSDDLIFDKTGKNQNSLHFKYNKFLISPYLERKFNHINSKSNFENQKNNELNNNTVNFYNDYESFGETSLFYPKPNYYNNIYTQRFSKKYKKFYNNNNFPSNYISNNMNPHNYYNPNNINSRNNIFKNETNITTLKTPDYQIKKEIEIQKTPDKYNNYRRYDDYYSNTINKERENNNPSNISKITGNNFINKQYNKNQFSSPYIQRQTRNYYL